MEKQRRTFLSYSRANKDFALRLARELKSEGFLVWLDQLDIQLGARWDVEVEKALEECEIFMIIMTPASIASENVRDEIGYAIDNGKRFLPVMLEKCNVPLRLRRFQYVDFTNKNFDDGVESAKELLRNLIAQPTMPRIIVSDEEQKQLAQAGEDRKAKEEDERLTAKKAESERLAKEKVEEEQLVKARMEADRKAKAEARRKAKEESERLAKQKAAQEEKAEGERLALAKAEAERKAKAETEQLAKQKAEEEQLAQANAVAERKAKDEAERQKADVGRVAKAESESKAKQEVERLAAQKVEAERLVLAKEEADRIAAQKIKALPAEVKPVSVTAPKKSVSKALIFGIVGVAAFTICAVGYGVVSRLFATVITNTPIVSKPATDAPVILDSTTEVQPTNTVVSENTLTPSPTRTSIVESTSVPSASDFFTEEFDSEDALANWETFSLGSGENNKLVIKQEDDHLLFDLGDEDLYVYYMYTPYEYTDVFIKLNAENRGRNNNNVSLVCRMNSDGTQWYEFSVESGGLWYLYAVEDKYNIIANGGTNALKQGQESNEYAMSCEGDEITLSINGQEIRRVTDKTYGFNSGLVGFNISSLNVLPITVEVNWFEISQP